MGYPPRQGHWDAADFSLQMLRALLHGSGTPFLKHQNVEKSVENLRKDPEKICAPKICAKISAPKCTHQKSAHKKIRPQKFGLNISVSGIWKPENHE